MFAQPAIGERFFGREEVLELLNKRILALKDGYRQNMAFTGQSLAGKTSILHHFLYTIKDESFIAIYIEIVKEPFRTFANRFVATLLYNSLVKIGVHTGTDISSIFDKAQRALPKTSLAIKQLNAMMERGDLDEAYSGLLGLTSVLKEEIKMPCVVILDEFDNLEHMGVKNPFLNFGKVIMLQKDTMYIVTSSRNQAIKKILSEKLSLLFGNFEIVKIAGFSLNTASDFIDSRLAGFDLDKEIKRFLIAFSDGNPFYLHHLTSSAKAIAIARMTSHIDRDIIAAAITEQLYESGGRIHQYLLSFILDLVDVKSREGYTAILTAIADGKNKQQSISRSLKMKPAEASKGLVKLAELGFITKSGVFHRIDDVVLEFWLKYVYRKRRDVIVDDIFNRMQRFEDEAGLYVAAFIEALGKDLIVKLSELFNLFSNELVPIESRQVKLPHFTKVEIKTLQDRRHVIIATFRGSSWIVEPFEKEVDDNDIIDYMRHLKASGLKISNKVIVPLKGIDENAKLLAKELKIAIWDTQTVNMLLNLYGKKRFVLL
jgi:predicted transcriptional regulator/GTPase SAR1 family protein